MQLKIWVSKNDHIYGVAGVFHRSPRIGVLLPEAVVKHANNVEGTELDSTYLVA